MAPDTGSSKNLVVIINTSNFEILEIRTIWPIEVDKSGSFYILPLSPGLQTFLLFCNALNVSSSKNKVAMSKVSTSINWKRRRSQTVWSIKIKKQLFCLFYHIC